MADGACTVCGGSEKEHFDDQGKQITVHAYTDKEGELLTPEQKRKKDFRSQAQPSPSAGVEAQSLGRLLSLLVEKGVLNVEEVLFVGGLGPRPSSSDPVRFRDPVPLLKDPFESIRGGI